MKSYETDLCHVIQGVNCLSSRHLCAVAHLTFISLCACVSVVLLSVGLTYQDFSCLCTTATCSKTHQCTKQTQNIYDCISSCYIRCHKQTLHKHTVILQHLFLSFDWCLSKLLSIQLDGVHGGRG